MTTACPFCVRIVNGETEPSCVEDVVKFEPLNPVTSGHLLFIPERHTESNYASAPAAVGSAMQAAECWGKHRKVDFNLIVSNGTAGTQTIPHLHIHYIPRQPGDGLHLPWTNQVVKMEEEFDETHNF